MGRSFERWIVARSDRQAPATAGNDRQPPAAVGIPPLPRATTAADPEYDADETTCMRCGKPWRSCECRERDAG